MKKTITIDESLRQRLKVVCAKINKTMADAVGEAVEKWIKEQENV